MQLEFDGLDEICINVEAIPTGLKKGDGGGFIWRTISVQKLELPFKITSCDFLAWPKVILANSFFLLYLTTFSYRSFAYCWCLNLCRWPVMKSHSVNQLMMTQKSYKKNKNKKISLLWCEYILFLVIAFPICLDFGHSSQLGTNCLFILFGQQKLMPNNLQPLCFSSSKWWLLCGNDNYEIFSGIRE